MRDQIFRLASREPVGDVGWPERRHGRDQHEAELHRREHRRPKFGNDAEHHQEPVAALGAQRAQAVGETGRFQPEIGEGPRLDALADDLEGDPLAMLALGELGVEPFERPVELARARPGESGARAVIVVLELEQPLARLAEGERLRRGARRGEGGDGHGAIVTPLDGADNGRKGAPSGPRLAAHFNQGASWRQVNPNKNKEKRLELLGFLWFSLVDSGLFNELRRKK